MWKITDSQEDLISIIIPVFNAERYLQQCLESIIHQTYQNLEIIIINDGSTDQSERIINEYKVSDPRIRVISQRNSGVSAARNAGIQAAKGAYIGFVDADDWIDPDMYRYLHSCINQYHTQICEAGITRDETELEKRKPDRDIIKVYTRDEYMKLFSKISSQEIKYYVFNKLFKADIIRNISFPSYSVGEDVVFSFLAISNAESISESKKKMYFYRQGSGITKTFNERYFELERVWEDVLTLAKGKNPQYYEWAKINKNRISFTLLSELALSGEDKSEKYQQKKKQLLSDLKKNIKELLKSNISWTRKVLIVFYCLNYNISASFVRHFVKRYQ